MTGKENAIAQQCWRVRPFKLCPVKTASEVPHKTAACEVKAQEIISLRDSIDAAAASYDIGADSEITFAAGSDQVFPSDLASEPVKRVYVALPTDVSADDYQSRGDKRIAVEATLIAILPDVVNPSYFSGSLVQRVEVPGTGTDEQ
jgi:hypothetical protein